ncbi:NAD(P)H-dependent glycerol-3-phosphate dehydrogenase [Candidiatus Paracoxiella cheracis]|uniref:NAD(P)H-dependent glycerol-3-phosphate dehydrogenase n=1 Tax=Candidiatus Paracoxiella cheracis TaxID=3405120 RepID=UPI003BF47959
MKQVDSPIAVLGAGSWGTALALLLARNNQTVRLWDIDAELVTQIQADRVNSRYIPDHPFPENISVYHDLGEVLESVTDILVVVPSHAFGKCIANVKSHRNGKATRLAWATKGLDPSNKLLHEVVEAVFGKSLPIAVIAGPSYAKEVAAGLPTAVSLASNDEIFAQDLIERFHNKRFRIYRNKDMIGIELCGAIKNVLAIAAGINDGMKLGVNSRCAMITRGLAEMSRLCIALGGQQETVVGLAGVGDLILTCSDNQSRNRRFGLALGEGIDFKSAEKAIGQAVEGLYNAKQVYELSQKYGVEMPIVTQVYRILHDHLNPRVAVKELLERTPKSES